METVQSQAQTQRHANMSNKATASNLLPNSLSQLTSMRDENIREKLNVVDGTRPRKYKLWVKKGVQYKTTQYHSAKGEVAQDIDAFS